MKQAKTFEISYGRNVYFGEYEFEFGKLIIDDMHTFNEDEEKVEIDSINDKEIYDRIYRLVEKEYSPEPKEYFEDY